MLCDISSGSSLFRGQLKGFTSQILFSTKILDLATRKPNCATWEQQRPYQHVSLNSAFVFCSLERTKVNLLGAKFQYSSSICRDFFLQFWEGVLGPFSLGKLAWQTPKLGNLLTHTIAIKSKENVTM